jgi:hypothetical protein
MDKITTHTGVGIISSIMGFLLGWWGSKIKIKELEDRIEEIHHTVRLASTCDERSGGIKARLENIERMNEEMRDDIKLLLRGQNSDR